ncbi:LysR substrate-binding domain-containing protein [Yersinia sp. LJYL362]|uniref:LysR substrate-binding domain-containing protein n=1 Tax=Yersinia sp. LJYL362 TaxID=3402108 RepID=UPI003AB2B3C7
MQQDDISEITMSGEYISDDGEIARRWALAGLGIANKAAIDVIADIRAGSLVQVLPDWQGEMLPFNLLCPHRSQVSERVRGLQIFCSSDAANGWGLTVIPDRCWTSPQGQYQTMGWTR